MEIKHPQDILVIMVASTCPLVVQANKREDFPSGF